MTGLRVSRTAIAHAAADRTRRRRYSIPILTRTTSARFAAGPILRPIGSPKVKNRPLKRTWGRRLTLHLKRGPGLKRREQASRHASGSGHSGSREQTGEIYHVQLIGEVANVDLQADISGALFVEQNAH